MAIQYKVKVGSSPEFVVDTLEISIPDGPNHGGWADLTITIVDKEEDIFDHADKKKVWLDWLKDCFNPAKTEVARVKKVEVRVVDGNNEYRKATIKKAYIASYVESTSRQNHSYSVTLKREPDLVPSSEPETLLA